VATCNILAISGKNALDWLMSAPEMWNRPIGVLNISQYRLQGADWRTHK